MLHATLVASIYVCAAVAATCTIEFQKGEILLRLRSNRHATIDLFIATGYVAVGAIGA